MERRDAWVTARASNEVGNCVEAYLGSDAVYVRDSKSRNAGLITVPSDQWRAFLTGLRTTTRHHTP